MKKLGILIAIFGLFVITGTASASSADVLQPAQATFNEDVDINGILRTDSLHVGSEAEGGVTYFNGSIVNVGADTPITIADDLRVDGSIYRTEIGGDNAIKVSDFIIPSANGSYGLGSATHSFGIAYLNNVSAVEEINITTNNITPVGTISNGEGVSGNPILIESIARNLTLSAPSHEVNILSDTRFKLDPQDGSGYTCNSSHYGEMIFSTTSLNSGGANKLYVCDSTGWNALD